MFEDFLLFKFINVVNKKTCLLLAETGLFIWTIGIKILFSPGLFALG